MPNLVAVRQIIWASIGGPKNWDNAGASARLPHWLPCWIWAL